MLGFSRDPSSHQGWDPYQRVGLLTASTALDLAPRTDHLGARNEENPGSDSRITRR